jgi:hypothetical protein
MEKQCFLSAEQYAIPVQYGRAGNLFLEQFPGGGHWHDSPKNFSVFVQKLLFIFLKTSQHLCATFLSIC